MHRATTTTDSLTYTIVTEVADHLNADAEDLPVLFEHINPDALAQVFEPITDTKRREGRISFRYAGVDVIVDRKYDSLAVTVEGDYDASADSSSRPSVSAD